jgi:hypothetical protein
LDAEGLRKTVAWALEVQRRFADRLAELDPAGEMRDRTNAMLFDKSVDELAITDVADY